MEKEAEASPPSEDSMKTDKNGNSRVEARQLLNKYRVKYFLQMMVASQVVQSQILGANDASLDTNDPSQEKADERRRAIILPRKDEDSDTEFYFSAENSKKMEKLEKDLPVFPAKDYTEAVPIFIKGRKMVEMVLKEISIEQDKEYYVNIVKDLSQMYKCLAVLKKEKVANVDTVAKMAKMQRRRILALEYCLQSNNWRRQCFDSGSHLPVGRG